MIKPILATLLTIACLLPLSARAADDYFTDGTGTRIAYGQDCQRIVSLMPNVTEMIAFLGYGKRLVGKSSFCNYPDSILGADDVGGQIDASIEKIVSLQPDIVLAYQGNSLELVEQLRQLGIQVCALKEARQLTDIEAQMRSINRVLGKPGAADPQALLDWHADYLQLRQARHAAGFPEQATVFFGYPGELIYTAGTEAFISDVISFCGQRNVVDIPDRWPTVSAEYVIAADPDWILTTTSCTEEEDPAEARSAMLAELRHDPVFSELRAVKQGHLIVVNSDHLLRPGPRILEGIRELTQQLGGPIPGEVSNNGAAAAN